MTESSVSSEAWDVVEDDSFFKAEDSQVNADIALLVQWRRHLKSKTGLQGIATAICNPVDCDAGFIVSSGGDSPPSELRSSGEGFLEFFDKAPQRIGPQAGHGGPLPDDAGNFAQADPGVDVGGGQRSFLYSRRRWGAVGLHPGSVEANSRGAVGSCLFPFDSGRLFRYARRGRDYEFDSRKAPPNSGAGGKRRDEGSSGSLGGGITGVELFPDEQKRFVVLWKKS